jgi:biofilm PGA synthesis N-glycosyltransferase PgaC
VVPTTSIDWFVQILIFILVAYPIVGGLAFIVSSIYYHLFLEKRDRPRYLQHGEPFVTIFIPAHNEEDSIVGTVRHLETRLNYPADKYEIIAIDDASTDQTAEILAGLQTECPHLRVITIVKNRGKAHAFNVALAYANGDFILSNDADTKPNPDALWQYMSYFEREGGQNVGAVTGNMLAANRTTVAAQAQQNELNSIIGLIKRSQMSYGALFAFSGANTMYRKQAVLDVAGWHAEQPTEDIAIAWDMQRAGWRALFAPHIRFFLDVPEQIRGLVKQRRRWSAGGIYVLLTKGPKLLRHPIRNFAMVPVILDYGFSIVWAFFYWISMALFILIQIYFAGTQNWERFFHNWYMVGIFVAIEMVVGLVQLTTASYFNDGGKTLKYILFAPWYLLIYWMVNTGTLVYEFIPTTRKIWARREGGVWKSPQRSSSLQDIRQNSEQQSS